MARSFADLEARVRDMASRDQRNKEDATAVGTNVLETQEDVRDHRVDMRVLKVDMRWLTRDVGGLKIDMHGLKHDMVVVKHDVSELKGDMGWVKRAVQALVAHQGVAVEPDDTDE